MNKESYQNGREETRNMRGTHIVALFWVTLLWTKISPVSFGEVSIYSMSLPAAKRRRYANKRRDQSKKPGTRSTQAVHVTFLAQEAPTLFR